MNKFLKDSKPMNAGLFDDGLWSTKPGGFRRAITEFKSFNPTNMKPTKEVQQMFSYTSYLFT